MLPAFRVAAWRVDPSRHTVTGPGGTVRLEPKVLQVLVCLAEHCGEVVAKEHLIESAWRGTFVTDDVLIRAISELRHVFADDARRPRVIETVPKGGYRLIAPVTWDEPTSATRGPEPHARSLAAARVEPVRAPALADSPATDAWNQDAPARGRPGPIASPGARVLRPSFSATVHQEVADRPAASLRSVVQVPKWAAISLLALLLITASIQLGRWYWHATGKPWVGPYRQVTRHEVLFPPFPSEVPVLTDGPRLYFTQFINGIVRPGMVAASGGEVQTLRFGLGEHEFIDAISPEGSELVVGAWNTDGSVTGDVPYWLVPLVRGAPRRLDDVVAHGSCWLPDGRILYANEHDLYTIDRHGRGKALLASLGGKAYWPRVSPDGRRVRFARFSSSRTFRVEALWEIGLDGTGLRPLLPGWNDPPAECCGEWTPDGSYYVFQSTRNGQTQLWALAEQPAWLLGSSQPVQLTSGPVQFRRPVFSHDGRTLFAIGWQGHGELTRFDPQSGAVTPYLPRMSAEWLTHARDGRWITYVTYPEGELWRARADGSSRLRLTAPGVRACCGRISPDATQVVFVGQSGDAPGRTYVVSMDGSGLREIGEGGEATWSPDGDSLVMATRVGLAHVTIDGQIRATLPGSEGLVSPVWSPDAKRIAAVGADSGRLCVYDIDRGRWRQLASLSVAFPNWSRDGRSLYFLTGRPAPGVIDTISRWHVDSDRVERLLDLTSYRIAWGITNHWLGLTPDDAPLFLRELSTHELFAWEWHDPH